MIAVGPVQRSSFRICSAPAPAAVYLAYGLDPAPAALAAATLLDVAWDNVRRVLTSATWASRYTNGDWPILYTASETKTAQSEKGYWIQTSVFSKGPSPTSVQCLEYDLRISGNMAECVSIMGADPKIVHPADYSFCHNLAKQAMALKVSFMEVPSARRLGGVNYPVFRLDAVVEVTGARASRFENAGTHMSYVSGSIISPVQIDDVFATLP